MRTSKGGSRAPAMPGSPQNQTPRIGDVLDARYRITGMLGAGGMGCVYLAEHVSIQRPLALKLLHPEVGEIDEVTKRFEREAFAIGRVDHPNCVKVSDFGKLADGTFYMVLELLDGLLLSDLLERDYRVDWQRALHIGRHVLSALAYAHDAGIVHRDVKPENVILVEQDEDPDFAKILDFGIAKFDDDENPDINLGLLNNDGKLTQHGVTIGTPTYIAPEQAYALPIDGRADLYSLSVMLYEMITGEPPFDADDVGTLLRMHVSVDVPRFETVAPDVEVPEAVEALIRHGLAKTADERIPTAKAYIERIDQILSNETGGQSGLRALPSLVAGGLRESLVSAAGLGSGEKKKPAKAKAKLKAKSKEKAKAKAKAKPKQKKQAKLKKTRQSATPPEQGAAKAPRRKLLGRRPSLRVIAASILAAIAFTAVAIAFGSSGPDYLPKGALLPIGPAAHGPEAEVAAELLAQGKPKEAAAYLVGHGKEVREEPYAQMVLGHAQASAQRSILALAAYEKAVQLEPKLAKDKLMRTNLALILDKRAPGVVDDAIELLGVLYALNQDWTAGDQLVDMASSSKDTRRRQKAMSVADEVGLGDQVDRLGSYLLDLEQGADCAERKDAVGKLRALGDKKAIPHLRKARKRMRVEGALMKRRVNTNACLRTAASEAVRYLNSL
ncbi:MAG: protein kinase domain-containing protein [Polyangiales bacterium]